MKKYILLSLLIVLTACNSKTDKKDRQEHTTFISEAGEVKGSNFVISNSEAISRQWEQSARMSLGDSVSLKDFEIKKAIAEGDGAEECYILQASSVDGMAKVAALLELKNGKFYFVENTSAPGSYRITICTGNCETGCEPVINIINGTKTLLCSSCPSCERIDSTV